MLQQNHKIQEVNSDGIFGEGIGTAWAAWGIICIKTDALTDLLLLQWPG